MFTFTSVLVSRVARTQKLLNRLSQIFCRKIAHWPGKKTTKSARRNANTALAVVRRSQKFRPAADLLPGDAGPPKFNQLT